MAEPTPPATMAEPTPPASLASSRQKEAPRRMSRRISLQDPGGSEGEEEVAASETFVQADEIHVPRWSLSPFPSTICSTYSCHGVQASRRTPGGRAKVNQDRGCVVQPFGGDRECALFAVFDGHGSRGEHIASFSMTFLRDELWRHPSFKDDIERALRETFEACDGAMEAHFRGKGFASPPEAKSGTTALVCVLRRDALTVASVGDSRCLVTTMDGEDMSGIALTDDHVPDLPVERARITAAGGFVKEGRVFLDEAATRLGLAMSRSLGDGLLKGCGVSATPTISTRDVSKDSHLVLATDGIWQVLSGDAVARVLEAFGEYKDADYACKNMIIEATALWAQDAGEYRDDITCMVVRLNPLKLTDVAASYVPVSAVHKQPIDDCDPTAASTQAVAVPRGQSIVLDTVGDGKYDTLGVDTTNDGRADTFYRAQGVDTNETGVEDHFEVFVDHPRRASQSAQPDPKKAAQRQASSLMAATLASPRASNAERETAVAALVSAIDTAIEPASPPRKPKQPDAQAPSPRKTAFR